jgi:hypothetical protein
MSESETHQRRNETMGFAALNPILLRFSQRLW